MGYDHPVGPRAGRVSAGLLLGLAVYLALVAAFVAAVAQSRRAAAIVLGAIVALPWLAMALDWLWMKYRERATGG